MFEAADAGASQSGLETSLCAGVVGGFGSNDFRAEQMIKEKTKDPQVLVFRIIPTQTRSAPVTQ